MIIHFICRGNAFRSIIAEAYLKSLHMDGVEVISSGSVADFYKSSNEEIHERTVAILNEHDLEKYIKPHYADQLNQGRLKFTDIAVCMNQIVYNECSQIVKLPKNTLVWEINDSGENGRVLANEDEWNIFMLQTYCEIRAKVDELVSKYIPLR